MNNREQNQYYNTIEIMLLVLGVIFLLYRKEIPKTSLFYRVHITPLLLSAICFILSVFVFGEKLARSTSRGSAMGGYGRVIAIGITILAIWDQITTFL